MSDQQQRVWETTQSSPEFAQLRKSFRGFAFPLTAAFLSWYFIYILLTAFARDFVVTPVIGNINIAFILGTLQFVSTFVIMWLYERHSSHVLDGASDKLRDQVEKELAQ
ncbi:DUF485 domain-containing protein [Aquiluna sp. KACHI24]|jgi:uncharacterized membrane protein (DUF485 family)|uniref:DUF485 domain-containing protein n=1 Tax=Aquiluna sp. KACHI24 TaxID=2968831 RepID=UPI002202658F|nr:DUF485 domain-containing protein [Aquiluna sp. KACHI24]BDQ00744.1 hypothetical protein AKACHI_10800 [Aquiluna sp. KACHI24]